MFPAEHRGGAQCWGSSEGLQPLQEESASRVTTSMAGSGRFKHHSRLALLTTLSAVSLLFLLSRAFRLEHEADRHKRDFPDPSDTPAVQIDPAAIDLTSLVNTLINSSQTGSQQLFSLLSVTSYSSLALHKLTLLVYNISSLRGVDSGVFRRRFCYCVTNQTSDLTDFTAVLLDVMGNSSSHLQELFKSSSFLSVSQRNDSDCIYICVMAGKMGRDIPDLWRDGSITPLFNQTIVESPHTVANMSSLELPAEWNQQSINLSHAAPSGMSSTLTSRDASTVTLEQKVALNEVTAGRPPTTFMPQTPTAGRQETPRTTQRFSIPSGGTETSASPPRTTTATSTSDLTPLRTHSSSSSTAPVPGPTSAASSQLPSEAHTAASGPSLLTAAATRTAAPQTSAAAETRFPPVQPTASSSASRRSTGRRTTAPNTLVQTEEAGCPWRRPAPNSESHPGSTTVVGAHKLQPCIFELCKFFSQCLCSQRTHTKRFCSDSHLWYEEHTAEVCRRVRRISFSRNLKQRCLTKMCSKL